MTEKRNTKGFVGLIIAGVLSIIVALGALGFFSSTKQPTIYTIKGTSSVKSQ